VFTEVVEHLVGLGQRWEPVSSWLSCLVDVLSMPVRKKPVSRFGAQQSRMATTGHMHGFVHYLEAECGLAANTVAAYQRDLQSFCTWLEQTQACGLQEVGLVVMADYLAHLHARGLAATTIARHLVSIKMLFRYLVLEGVLSESAVDLMSSPKLWQRLPQVLSPEKVNELLNAPTAEDRYVYRDRALLALLYATGCRASEVAGMRLRDVHLDEAFCRCLGKGNKERLVSLNPLATRALQAYLDQERSELAGLRDAESLLLTRSGNPLSRVMVWKLVKKYAARVGCSQQVSPHSLRHSFATHMLAGGAGIRALQELLGHASVATTQIYTQVEHSRLKAVHERCHPRG